MKVMGIYFIAREFTTLRSSYYSKMNIVFVQVFLTTCGGMEFSRRENMCKQLLDEIITVNECKRYKLPLPPHIDCLSATMATRSILIWLLR